MKDDDSLTLIFSALADPTRRAILQRLAHGVQSVGELAEPFHISAPAVTKHLKVLEDAGLIKRSRIAQKRPCELQAAPLQAAANWIETYRQYWEDHLDRLDSYLKRMQEPTEKKETSDVRNSKKTD
jgi:DNA-binding transcriptional ArsR family regulator